MAAFAREINLPTIFVIKWWAYY